MNQKRERTYTPPPAPFGHEYGYQPPARYGTTGSLRWHMGGCVVNGGKGLPRGACKKCAETIDRKFYKALMRQDQRRKKADVRD